MPNYTNYLLTVHAQIHSSSGGNYHGNNNRGVFRDVILAIIDIIEECTGEPYRTLRRICKRGYISAEDKEVLSEYPQECFKAWDIMRDRNYPVAKRFRRKIRRGKLGIEADSELIDWFFCNARYHFSVRTLETGCFYRPEGWYHECTTCRLNDRCMLGPKSNVRYVTKSKDPNVSASVESKVTAEPSMSVSPVYWGKYMANMTR